MTSTQVLHQGTIRLAEARFYFQAKVEGVEETLALCSIYSPVDFDLREYTHGTLNICNYEGEDSLIVIRVASILSVVAMVPVRNQVEGLRRQYFLVEKFALGVVDIGDSVD